MAWPDGKLDILVGDVGRRGQLQNLRDGPFGPGQPGDQFGGPQPDNAHLTGVILRLGDDGSTPPDNPFFDVGASIGGQVGGNIQKIFAHGLRNSFGLQQVRWPPTNIADSPEQALSRLFAPPGAHDSAPEFAWKFEVAPAAIGFVHGRAWAPSSRVICSRAAPAPSSRAGTCSTSTRPGTAKRSVLTARGWTTGSPTTTTSSTSAKARACSSA